ncbi:hypothetical protein ACSBR1_000168 [Camellia fascicularis]
MEKPTKSKNKFLKFLPKAASAVTFQSPPFSPTKDKRCSDRLKTHIGKGFSGPIISIIPEEARRKTNNSRFEEPQEQEPTSPKVSCMGQIKHKNKNRNENKNKTKKKKEKSVPMPKEFKPVMSTKSSTFQNVLPGRKSDSSVADRPKLPDRAPSLSQMRRFASGRDSNTKFDWTAQIMPVDGDDDSRSYYSDEEIEGEEREIIIPFSAPILGGGNGDGVGLEKRKEINLWKRRTMAQPRPLQVNTLVRSC